MASAKSFKILSFSVLAASLALAGCMSFGTPVTSIVKLARMQPLEADPGAIRFAVATPAFMHLRDGDIIVTVKFDSGDPRTSFVEQYKPVVMQEEADTSGIDRDRLGGQRLAFARFHDDDRQAFRAMQARVKAFKETGKEGKGSLSIGATGCRVGPVPDGPVRLSTWLRTSPDEAYFPLMRDFDLRAPIQAAGGDLSDMPLCEDASAPR